MAGADPGFPEGRFTAWVRMHVNIGPCLQMGSDLDFMVTSLVPRPYLQGGKGSGDLGQNPCACAEEFIHANEITALGQSHDKLTTGMQHHSIAVYI